MFALLNRKRHSITTICHAPKSVKGFGKQVICSSIIQWGENYFEFVCIPIYLQSFNFNALFVSTNYLLNRLITRSFQIHVQPHKWFEPSVGYSKKITLGTWSAVSTFCFDTKIWSCHQKSPIYLEFRPKKIKWLWKSFENSFWIPTRKVGKY